MHGYDGKNEHCASFNGVLCLQPCKFETNTSAFLKDSVMNLVSSRQVKHCQVL